MTEEELKQRDELHRVEVVWLDAMYDEGHPELSYVETLVPLVCRNVGYLVKKTLTDVTIVFGTIENPVHRTIATDVPVVFPIGMVKEINYLMVKDGSN